jgi:hypothetical protein
MIFYGAPRPIRPKSPREGEVLETTIVQALNGEPEKSIRID